MTLAERIERALRRLRAPGISGWGLDAEYLAERFGGEVALVEPAWGCTSETCAHNSHDPAAPVLKWIPPEGCEIVRLGSENLPDEYEAEYFVVRRGDEEHYLYVSYHRSYHTRVYEIDAEEVPDWAFAQLAEEGGDSEEGGAR